jgi:hypothetical protein
MVYDVRGVLILNQEFVGFREGYSDPSGLELAEIEAQRIARHGVWDGSVLYPPSQIGRLEVIEVAA